MNFYEEILKGCILFFTIGILLEIITDFYTTSFVEISIADLVELLITGVLVSIFIVPLSFRWKKYYENKKPQK
ncbi:hypothetical protein [Gramella sp. AN32]|uniref:Uncharacterized protein n=1 Tax=Christiangramia antarctica TaxID=2058158 RepID=A0ABW5WZ92_9FLAO|nr:hypothetical protein [Gramella sp. AN32]MCM4154914.1 hypothetical protein [Gramella sp. AN32]